MAKVYSVDNFVSFVYLYYQKSWSFYFYKKRYSWSRSIHH